MKRLSIIITNYNYARFLSEAVESALAVEWDDVEVVVVDDGSTDDSLIVLKEYGDRIVVIASENRGQREAANLGFAASSGDVVLFLDADDVLPSNLAVEAAEVWGPRVSKVQFQVQPIDASGRALRRAYPRFDPVPSPADIRHWMVTTSAYPTPPGSANLYARWCLAPVFPLDDRIGPAADSGCLALAALLGDVMTVPSVVVGYRWHSGQLSDLVGNPRKFSREVYKARGRWALAHRAAGVAEDKIDYEPLSRSRELLQFRVAARRISMYETGVDEESVVRLLRDIARSPIQPGPDTVFQRGLVFLWCLATLVGPRVLVPRLIQLRYGRG